ncbi:UNKNOWN [Stylonychia lemnae]|uniref:Tyrosine-protein kinase ephrin type A/B receptor-like domain-containing protein n=1 Tax=Stylonychia lemnae TaxID=5949 RepID=A0A077ZNB3_STYLE|nr:UNKNOWN [Stylonychia lemnae]|eukprot:CDW71408.1 UNKNOWN [Stylonychia lemnae]
MFFLQVNRHIKIRECLAGEVLIENKCQICTKGTYSLAILDQTCNLCPANMRCDGGNMISVDKNYWRSSLNTTIVLKCPKVGVCLQVCQSFQYTKGVVITQSAVQDIKENCALNAQKILMEITMQEIVNMIAQNAYHWQNRYPY